MESRLRMEPLEDRTLLTIDFLAGVYTTPTNRLDVGLGTISGFAPVEPTIVVNPADPGNLAVSSHTRLRLSTNAGGSFTGTFAFTNPPGTTDTGGDTDTIFDSQGRLFWSNLAGIGAGGVSVNEVNPVTGANISTVNVRSNGDDKEFITADQNPLSPFQDNLYMVWTGNFGISTTEVYFSRSTNQSVNWSAPVQLSNHNAEGFPWPSDVGVAPNGDVYVAYHAGGSSGAIGDTWVLRSTDGGVTFPQKNQAFLPGQSDITFNVQTDPGTIPQTQFWMQGAAQPWVLADPVRPGNIYIINSDDPNNAHGSAVDDVNIVIARSTNNGLNWATATVPVDAGPGSHQFYPTAAIDEFGNIVVAWYDNRNLATNASGRWLLDVFATYSTDGGLTWAAPFQVNDVTNPFDPDIGAVNRFNGPPPTTRIGEYFGLDLFGGTAYVAWNGSNPVGGPQVGHQVVFSAFAINGTLMVDGDLASDTVEIRNIAGNTDFIEVLVNGDRQYAGLREALSGGIMVETLGGADNLIVDFSFGNPIPTGGLAYDGGTSDNQVSVIGDADYVLTGSSLTRSAGGIIDLVNVQIASLTGGASGNTFDVSGWTGTGAINGLGNNDVVQATKDANMTLGAISLAASDGMSMALASIELANLTGGASDNSFSVLSWNGPSVNLAGLGGSDSYGIGNGDLDTIAAAVNVADTAGAADGIAMNDGGNATPADYTVDGTSVTTQITGGGARAFLGLTYNADTIEMLSLTGTTVANNFYVTPHELTEFNIHGNNPTFAGPGVDYLEV
ncbi:MAG: sialidase family protein, partial [Pirellulales bacterium]